jgi:large subunit ribosomal protein L31
MEIHMAKAGIHPDYHTITVVMTDGSRYETRSTYGKEGDVLTLDVDPKTHPAWVGGVNLRKTGRLESFNNRFGGIASVNKAPNSDVSEAEKKN